MSAVPTNLQNFMDKQDILELIYSYAFTFDGGNVDAWIELFTEDAYFETFIPSRTQPTLQASGKSAILKAIQKNLDHNKDARASLPYLSATHLQSATIFDELDETTAKVRTMVHTFMQTCSDDSVSEVHPADAFNSLSLSPLFSGIYYSSLRKVDGRWKFAGRRFVADMHAHPGAEQG